MSQHTLLFGSLGNRLLKNATVESAPGSFQSTEFDARQECVWASLMRTLYIKGALLRGPNTFSYLLSSLNDQRLSCLDALHSRSQLRCWLVAISCWPSSLVRCCCTFFQVKQNGCRLPTCISEKLMKQGLESNQPTMHFSIGTDGRANFLKHCLYRALSQLELQHVAMPQSVSRRKTAWAGVVLSNLYSKIQFIPLAKSARSTTIPLRS